MTSWILYWRRKRWTRRGTFPPMRRRRSAANRLAFVLSPLLSAPYPSSEPPSSLSLLRERPPQRSRSSNSPPSFRPAVPMCSSVVKACGQEASADIVSSTSGRAAPALGHPRAQRCRSHAQISSPPARTRRPQLLVDGQSPASRLLGGVRTLSSARNSSVGSSFRNGLAVLEAGF